MQKFIIIFYKSQQLGLVPFPKSCHGADTFQATQPWI